MVRARVILPCAGQEPLGLELIRLGVQVFTEVDRRDAGQHERPGRNAVAGQIDVLGQAAGQVHKHRPDAQCLLDRGLQILVSLGQRLLEAIEHGRVTQQALERPGHCGGGGLMSSTNHGHQFVAQLLIGHWLAILIGGTQEQ